MSVWCRVERSWPDVGRTCNAAVQPIVVRLKHAHALWQRWYATSQLVSAQLHVTQIPCIGNAGRDAS
jgi:hypothetical protein